MKNRILPILLLISPYFYLLIYLLFLQYGDSSTVYSLPVILSIYFVLVAAVYVPNMVFARRLAKQGAESHVLLFWDMLLKLCHIPFYLLTFLTGLVSALVPPGLFVAMIFMIFDYLLLLPSSVYGVYGLIQARKENKITSAAAVVNGILHFLFCTDVFSAVIMFRKVKANGKK